MLTKFRTRNSSSGDLTVFYSDATSTTSRGTMGLSIADVKREIDSPLTQPCFRIYWLNPDETVKKEVPQEDIIDGGSYNENYQNGQRRTLSFTLFNGNGEYTPSINGVWAGTKFSLEVGLETVNGTTIWFPKGIYVVTSVSPTHSTDGMTVSVSLGDKYSLLTGASGTLETTYTIEPGSEIESIIRDILSSDKGDGYVLDPKPFIYDSLFKGKKTQATITQEAGSTYGDIINELATQLSAEVFYDVEGHLNLVAINEVTNEVDKPILYDFYEDKGDFGENNFSFNFEEVVNRVIVIGSNVNSLLCQATAVNDDPSSPLCYQRIGYRTASPINDSNITTIPLAEERATYELRNKLILKSSITTPARFNPLLLVNNLITVTDEFYGLYQEKFLIQSLSFNLDSSGTMSITSTNVRNIPFATGG